MYVDLQSLHCSQLQLRLDYQGFSLGQLRETAKATFWIPRTINQPFFRPIALKEILSNTQNYFKVAHGSIRITLVHSTLSKKLDWSTDHWLQAIKTSLQYSHGLDHLNCSAG